MSQLTFNYQAIDRSGARRKGTITAGDRNDAYRQLVSSGLKPMKLASASRGGLFQRRGAISPRDLSHLTRQLEVMFEARIPIADGLRSIAEQEKNQRLQQVLNGLAQEIEGGRSITDALSPHRNLFGDVYVETIRAAEASGNMVPVLGRLAEVLDARYETSKQFRGALAYPICVVVALAIALTFLLIAVVPKYATMFEKRGVPLPAPTQMLIACSDVIRGYWMVIIGAMFAVLVVWRWALRKAVFRQQLDRLFMRVPFFRDLLQTLAISRFAHVLGLSLESGLGLIESIEMSGNASGRPLLMADAVKMRESVKQGGQLSDVIKACSYIPTFARRMLVAGDQGADLPRMCRIISDHYDREVAHLSKNIATVVEPILIAGLAGVILVVALAMFLPMWEMASLVG